MPPPGRRPARRVRSRVPDPFTSPVTEGFSRATSDVLFGSAKPIPPSGTFRSAVERVRSNFAEEDPETETLEYPEYSQEVFTYDPTRSINPPRPRTRRAGWIRPKGSETGTVVVQFREGAVYEYLNVPYNVWRQFRRVQSPGRHINRTLNAYPYRRVSG